ncbi:hypothetical protein MED222_05270 [Vibrio sp. MED222]|nr:hypothetical protein MED222_05270 [Vibrio sp. MED222]
MRFDMFDNLSHWCIGNKAEVCTTDLHTPCLRLELATAEV